MKLTEEFVLTKTHCDSLVNVRRINLWGEQLTDVTVVSLMPNLEIASFSVNSITSVASFASCRKLRELYVRKNSIADLSEIRHLRKLPDLRVLWLSENPCAAGERYRLTVIRNLPNLDVLDNVRVNEEERLASTSYILYDIEVLSEVSDPLVVAPHAVTKVDRLVVNGSSTKYTAMYDKRRYEEAGVSAAGSEVRQSGESGLGGNVNSDANKEDEVSNEEELDVGAYWQTVASVADQIMARNSNPEDDEPCSSLRAGAEARSGARRRRARKLTPKTDESQSHDSSPLRPVSRKGVRSRRDTKLVDAILSLVDIVDDRSALERIRSAIESRISALTIDAVEHETASHVEADSEKPNAQTAEFL